MELITVLRKATSYDCEAIYNAHLFAARYACKNCYSDEILQVWSRLLYPESYLEGIKHKELWVAEYKHKIQGFFQLDIAKAELDALYVHPFVHNRGIGTALLQKAENLAFEADLTFVKLYASLNSTYFYHINHYHTLEKCQLMLDEEKDIFVDCLLMKKDLLKNKVFYNY